jgi:hypothetical protein
MPGVKGKSGGARDGAGKKLKTFTLKLGDVFYLSDGCPGEIATVTEITRTKLTLTAGGRIITLVR